MLGFDELVGRNATLSEQEYRHIDAEIDRAALQPNVGRLLFGNPYGPLGLGVQSYGYDKWTEMKEAVISMAFEDTKDLGKKARTNLDIPITQETFFLNRRDLESSRRFGIPLDASQAELALYQVMKKEDALLLNGWSMDGTTYNIKGLYQSANNTVGGASWATAGRPNTDVASAKAALVTDHIYRPYNLVVHPDQYAEMAAYTANHTKTNEEEILKMLGPGSGIFETPAITAGTAMLLATPNRGYFKHVIAQDLVTEYWDVDKKGTMGRVFLCGIPKVNETNAICSITGI